MSLTKSGNKIADPRKTGRMIVEMRFISFAAWISEPKREWSGVKKELIPYRPFVCPQQCEFGA